MKKNIILFVCLFLSLIISTRADPQKIIIDTDMGFDVDDVGAVTVGNAL